MLTNIFQRQEAAARLEYEHDAHEYSLAPLMRSSGFEGLLLPAPKAQ